MHRRCSSDIKLLCTVILYCLNDFMLKALPLEESILLSKL